MSAKTPNLPINTMQTTSNGAMTSVKRQEIVFVQNDVADLAQILKSLDPSYEVHILDAKLNGLTQIAEILQDRRDIDALHIVSHGAEATINLGQINLNTQRLSEFDAELSAISRSLSVDADILLYGCDIAEGAKGWEFINRLASQTGADINASTDATGSHNLGGNWQLEAKTGGIESNSPFVLASIASYNYLLAVPADQNFEGTSNNSNQTSSRTINNIVYSSNGAAWVDVLDDVAIFLDAFPPNFTGRAIWNGHAGSTDSATTYFAFSSLNSNDKFKLNSLAANAHDDAAGAYLFTITGYSGGSGGTQIVQVTNFDFRFSATYGTGNSAIVYSEVSSGYNGGNLSFGSAWNNIDTVVFTKISGSVGVSLALDTIDFSAPLVTSITSATYDANAGILSVVGTEMTNGGTIDVSKLSITGQGGTYTLTTGNVTTSSATSFSVTLNAADKIAVNGVLNNNGTTSVTGGVTFNLAAAANWDVTAAAAADLTGNAVTVSNVVAPTLSTATYDANSGTLVVTGTNLVKAIGSNNDITANKISVRAEANVTYVLTDTADVEITSATSFTLVLSANDKAALNQLVNKKRHRPNFSHVPLPH